MHSGMVYKAAEAVSLCQFSGLVHKRLKCANIVSTYFCRYLLLMHCEFSFQTCPKCEDSFCRRMIYAIAILLNLQHPLPIDTSKPQNQPAHCYTLAWREFLFPFLDASLFFAFMSLPGGFSFQPPFTIEKEKIENQRWAGISLKTILGEK